MIRFGVVLSAVLAAIGLLVAGVIAGSLMLVAVSVGVAALAAMLLLIAVLVWRHEIFGSAAGEVRAGALRDVPGRGRDRQPA